MDAEALKQALGIATKRAEIRDDTGALVEQITGSLDEITRKADYYSKVYGTVYIKLEVDTQDDDEF